MTLLPSIDTVILLIKRNYSFNKTQSENYVRADHNQLFLLPNFFSFDSLHLKMVVLGDGNADESSTHIPDRRWP